MSPYITSRSCTALTIIAFAFIAAIDFLSKNIRYFMPSTRTIPSQIVPDYVKSYWATTTNNNILIGIFLIVPIIAILFIILKNQEIRLSYRRFDIIIFIIAFMIGFMLWSLPESNVDYIRYFITAKAISQNGFINYLGSWQPFRTDLPLIPVLFGFIFHIFGISRTAIQFFTTLCFAGTVFLTYRIGKAYWNDKIGFFSSLVLISASPYVLQVPRTLVDTPFVFLIVSFAYSLLITYRSRFWILGSLFSIMLIPFTLLAKLTSIIFLPVIFIAITLIELAHNKNRKKIISRMFIILFSATMLLISFSLVFYDKLLLFSQGRPWIGKVIIAPFPQNLLELFLAVSLRANPLGLFRNSIYLVGAIVVISSFISIIYLMKRQDARFLLILLWGIVPLFLLPGGDRFDLTRYLFPLLPAFGIGFAVITSNLDIRIKHLILAAILLSSLFTASLIQIPAINATGMGAINSTCNIINSLEPESVGIIHVAETARGKSLIKHSDQLMIHFEYLSPNTAFHYYEYQPFFKSESYPDMLIVVSDSYKIPQSLYFFLSYHNYTLIHTNEGYLGGVWSPLICHMYVSNE